MHDYARDGLRKQIMDWEYAPAPESAAIAGVKDRYLPFIDGTFVEGAETT